MNKKAPSAETSRKKATASNMVIYMKPLRRARWLVSFLLLVVTSLVICAAVPNSGGPLPDDRSQVSAVALSSSTSGRHENVPETLNVRISAPDATSILSHYYANDSKNSLKSFITTNATAIWTLLGVLCTGLVTGYVSLASLNKQRQIKLDLQREQFEYKKEHFKEKEDRRLLRKQALMNHAAGLEGNRAALKFYREAFEHFLAPLHALLVQNKVLNKRVYLQIFCEAHKNQNRWNGWEVWFFTEEEVAQGKQPTFEEIIEYIGDDRYLYLKYQDHWTPLRMLDFMPELMLDEVTRLLTDQSVRIALKIGDLILANGSLVASSGESPEELMRQTELMGLFLAHVVIFKALHERYRVDKSWAGKSLPGEHRVGYYPRDFDDFVRDRYEEAHTLIRRWQDLEKTAN